jgi:RHS repeat-associated protein
VIDGAVSSDRVFVRSSDKFAEERTSAGGVVKQFFSRGMVIGGIASISLKDHLGSVREEVSSGAGGHSSFMYDMQGQLLNGGASVELDFGFADYFKHGRSGLYFTETRQYSPTHGVWISRDPIGEAGGVNLFCYVSNSPVFTRDPSGLDPMSALESRLRGICDDPKCGVKDASLCKADAAILASKIGEAWAKAPLGRRTTTKDNCRGYMCWEWALGFASAWANAAASNDKFSWTADYREWQPKKGEARRHYATRFTPKGANPNCCGVTVDDGYLSDNEVHGADWDAAGWLEMNQGRVGLPPDDSPAFGPKQNPWRNIHP